MKEFESKLYKYRCLIGCVLAVVAIISSFRHVDDMPIFFLTMAGHALFGLAIYCYVTGRLIAFGIVGIYPDAPLWQRRAGGFLALFFFVLMPFYFSR